MELCQMIEKEILANQININDIEFPPILLKVHVGREPTFRIQREDAKSLNVDHRKFYRLRIYKQNRKRFGKFAKKKLVLVPSAKGKKHRRKVSLQKVLQYAEVHYPSFRSEMSKLLLELI